MKILYLKLVNFANILSGMKRHSVEIDFSKSKNRVIILMGENGTGKSSILSQLHPFANTGSGDQRNAKGLMIEGKEAYKEIHIQDQENIYVIKHFYSKSGTTKSYIAKNQQELNPNGNVTSFLEHVYDELTVALDFLKLLRLGSNAPSFLRMSTLDRKKYTTNLLSDVDVFFKYYKIINDKLRLSKGLLKNTVSRLNQLRVVNREEIETKLINLQEKMNDLVKSKDENTAQYGAHTGEQASIAPNGVNEIIVQFETLKAEYKELEKLLKKAEELKSIIELESEFDTINKELISLEKEIAEDKVKLESSLNSLSDTLDSLTEYQQQMQIMSSSADIDRLTQSILTMNRERESLNVFEDKELPYTTEEARRALELMKQIQEVASLMLGFDEDAKAEVVAMWRDNGMKNPENEIHEMNAEINVKIQKLKSSTLAAQHSSKVDKDEIYFIYKPTGCPGDCPFEDFYNKVTDKDFDSNNTDKTMRKLEKKKEVIDDYFAVNSNINYIQMIMNAHKALIDKMPNDFFDFDSILLGIEKDSIFYDEEYITTFISISEKLDRYHQLGSMIKEMQKELKMIQDNSSSFKLIESEVMKLTVRRDKLESDIEKLRNNLYHNESKVGYLTQSLNEVESLLKLSKEKEEMVKKHAELYKTCHQLHTNIERYNDLNSLIDHLTADSKQLSFEMKKVTESIEYTKHALIAYDELIAEKDKLESEFEDMEIMKESLSSNKGIPLVFVKLYMADSEIEINDLLDIVYDGDLQVSKFVIDENEFTIPYVRNGITVSDISQCSQGEETFLSLAISFSFGVKSMERYNIMLMDELDGALDTKKRMLFLEIIESHLDRLGVEQLFLTSHNNAFDSYPIDVILTSEVNLDSYRNTNVIFKAV